MNETLDLTPITARHTSPPHIYGNSDDDEQSTLYGPPVFPDNSPLYSSNDESTSSSKSPLLPSPSNQRKLDDNSIQSTASSKSPSLLKPSNSVQRRLPQPGKSKPKKVKPKKGKPRKSNVSKSARRAQAKKALKKAREAKKKKHVEKIKLAAIQAEKDKNDSELKDKFNCSDVSIDLEKCDDTIERHKVKPIELKEKDPIFDHVSCEQPDQVDLLTEKDKPITS